MLLLPYSGSENRAVFEQSLLERLAEQGFLVDGYVANKEGTYVTQDEFGEPFLIKKLIPYPSDTSTTSSFLPTFLTSCNKITLILLTLS